MFNEEGVVKEYRKRASLLGYLIIFAFALILSRLWYLQVYKGDLLFEYSLRNRLRKEVVHSPRGMVFSRDNYLLVDNIPRFDAAITPQYLKNKKKTLNRLSKILNMPVKKIKAIITKNRGQARYKQIVLKKNISFKEVAIIETENDLLPGVSVETFISREYRDKEIGAHLLGYISTITPKQLETLREKNDYLYELDDFVGQFGLEEQLDVDLRGKDGHEFVEVDARGIKKRHINTNLFQGVENRPSHPGKNIVLTIDHDMQKVAYESLSEKVGSVVAMDVNTGEILAMVSHPSFNPSEFSRGLSTTYWNSLVNNKNKPMTDRTIQEHYSPGSTFKVITAIAALEEKLIDEKTELICKGKMKVGRKMFHCWKSYGHGKVSMVKAIRESCNIYFQKIAKKLDFDVLAKYATYFGLGSKTGIQLPREISGLIPTKKWKKDKFGIDWQLGDSLTCAIGQSYILTTPLQLVSAYSMIANGGKKYRPYIVKKVGKNGTDAQNKKLLGEVKISNRTLRIVKRGLYEVVNHPKGTAFASRGKGINMAGKTGTSQVIRMSAEKLYSKCEEYEYKHRNHGVFVSYAPEDNPKLAISVVIEHGCHGSTAAAPIAKKVMTAYMQKYHNKIEVPKKIVMKKIAKN